jgi:hypothetical protein
MKTMINHLNLFTIAVNSLKNNDSEIKDSQREQIILEPKHESPQLDQDLTDQEKPRKQRNRSSGQLLSILKTIFSWSTLQLLISHHPNCDVYEHHVFKIGKLRFCRGCTLSYPPAYFLPIIWLAWWRAQNFFKVEGFLIPNIWWFTIAFAIFGVITFFIKKYSIYINDIYKVTRGALLGFFFIIMLQEPWYYKLSIGIIVLGLMTYLSFKRGKDMEKTCNECEWGANFHECPGWKDMNLFTSPDQNIPIDVDKLQPKEPTIATDKMGQENSEQ